MPEVKAKKYPNYAEMNTISHTIIRAHCQILRLFKIFKIPQIHDE